jgi:hypothetical protein
MNYDRTSAMTITTELDRMDPASLLLDCTLEALSIDRSIRATRPLVTEHINHYDDYLSIYSSIMGKC